MKLRQLARNRPCMVRVPGVCNFDVTTTILAHLNGAGLGIKHHDLHGAWCCSDCHDYVDGRSGKSKAKDREWLLLWGVIRTQQQLIKEGTINGDIADAAKS